MICPFCKNEKFNETVCPYCQLDGAAALLESAQKFQKEKNWGRAAGSYRQYLRENPEKAGVAAGLAYCAWQEALLLRTPESYVTADKDLSRALSLDWGWEDGHQYRVQLSVLRGTLQGLREEYELAVRTDPSRQEKGLQVLKVIDLSEKFTQAPPESGALSERTGIGFLSRIYWPLEAGILLSLGFSAVVSGDTTDPKTLVFLTSLVLFADFALIVFSLYLYRKVKSKDRKRDYEKNPRSIRPPNLSDWDRK